MDITQTAFGSTVEREVFGMLCGDYIGDGAGREVYSCAYDDTLVIKIENGAQSFQNITEWNLWHDASGLDHAREWLAPCVNISPCGLVLVQKRTKPAKVFPEKIPVWLTDTKRENFGMIGRRFVCHDYGYNLMCNSGLSKRLKKAEWWDS